jgi:hypothetical protein
MSVMQVNGERRSHALALVVDDVFEELLLNVVRYRTPNPDHGLTQCARKLLRSLSAHIHGDPQIDMKIYRRTAGSALEASGRQRNQSIFAASKQTRRNCTRIADPMLHVRTNAQWVEPYGASGWRFLLSLPM